MGECTPSPSVCHAVSWWRTKHRARYRALLTDTYRRVDVELLPDERVLEPEPELRVLEPELELEPDERVLLLLLRVDEAAGERLVLVVPELRTRVVVVLPERVDDAGCAVD